MTRVTEWKPGDVALVTRSNGDTERAIRQAPAGGPGWETASSAWRADRDGGIIAARPLVVIDPEDREQVERLGKLYFAHRIAREPNVREQDNAMQAALREFADPTTSKPEEPTGLGAVVEDDEGVLWVRSGKTREGQARDDWRCTDGEYVGYWSKWSGIAVVRVLSEGVQ